MTWHTSVHPSIHLSTSIHPSIPHHGAPSLRSFLPSPQTLTPTPIDPPVQIAPPPPRHLLPSAAQAPPPFHRPLSTTARVSLAGERGDAAQQPRRRGWLARRRTGACFDAWRFVELAGPRRARGLHRVCSGGATRRPQVSGYQEGAAADSSRSSRVTKRSCRAQARPRRPTTAGGAAG